MRSQLQHTAVYIIPAFARGPARIIYGITLCHQMLELHLNLLYRLL